MRHARTDYDHIQDNGPARELADHVLSMGMVTAKGQRAQQLARQVLGIADHGELAGTVTVNTNGTYRTIPADEPVFLIRGQDLAGGDAVRAWAELAESAGAAPDILAVAREHAGRMDAWPKKKVADLVPEADAPTVSSERAAEPRLTLHITRSCGLIHVESPELGKLAAESTVLGALSEVPAALNAFEPAERPAGTAQPFWIDCLGSETKADARLAAMRAESVARGKMLVRCRNRLINACDGLMDQGDIVSFGSTNDADDFRETVKELDNFKWSMILAENDEPDLFTSLRQANARADRAEAEVRALTEASLYAQLPLAARNVLAERRRQVEAEGWTPAHDDQHHLGEMAWAAAAYAEHSSRVHPSSRPPALWPWHPSWWKPTTPRQNLVKSGTLILAEIERIDRAEPSSSKHGGE